MQCTSFEVSPHSFVFILINCLSVTRLRSDGLTIVGAKHTARRTWHHIRSFRVGGLRSVLIFGTGVLNTVVVIQNVVAYSVPVHNDYRLPSSALVGFSSDVRGPDASFG